MIRPIIFFMLILTGLLLTSRSYCGTPADHEAFELPNGVNELELIYLHKEYYLFHHDFNSQKTYVNRARSVNELGRAKSILVLPGLYPTVNVNRGIWHAWVWDGGKTVHYVANTWSGPYKPDSAVNLPNATDWQVRRNPRDGWYYASYKDIRSLHAGLARAQEPEGPWQDLGDVFASDQHITWHAAEEADAAIFFYQAHVYMTFSGWQGPSFALNSGEQVLGIVELDPHTFKALDVGKILLRPTKAWQQVGGGKKIFNPVFLAAPGQPPRIFYAVNPTADHVPAGWGFITNPLLPNTETTSSKRRITGESQGMASTSATLHPYVIPSEKSNTKS